ncbi:SDR family oxidoreductase, partial [Verrucomicrobia bacterium]|nr:SDR family oxidoreductase [Verrucomicrobiota bacterium]
APLVELTEENWDRTIKTNLKGPFLCSQQAARRMSTGMGGSIINIGSGANKSAFPGFLDHCVTKAGVDQLTRVSAIELGPFGVRVNCVAPGAIAVNRTLEENPDFEGTWAKLTPLKTVGDVVDIADAVCFLASQEARFINGQTLYVDGGLWSQVPWPFSQ